MVYDVFTSPPGIIFFYLQWLDCLTGVMFSIVSFFSSLFSRTNYLFNSGLGDTNGLLLMEVTSLVILLDVEFM